MPNKAYETLFKHIKYSDYIYSIYNKTCVIKLNAVWCINMHKITLLLESCIRGTCGGTDVQTSCYRLQDSNKTYTKKVFISKTLSPMISLNYHQSKILRSYEPSSCHFEKNGSQYIVNYRSSLEIQVYPKNHNDKRKCLYAQRSLKDHIRDHYKTHNRLGNVFRLQRHFYHSIYKAAQAPVFSVGYIAQFQLQVVNRPFSHCYLP